MSFHRKLSDWMWSLLRRNFCICVVSTSLDIDRMQSFICLSCRKMTLSSSTLVDYTKRWGCWSCLNRTIIPVYHRSITTSDDLRFSSDLFWISAAIILTGLNNYDDIHNFYEMCTYYASHQRQKKNQWASSVWNTKHSGTNTNRYIGLKSYD